jgi:hypothetical protein
MCVIKNFNKFRRIYHIQNERKAGRKLVLRRKLSTVADIAVPALKTYVPRLP